MIIAYRLGKKRRAADAFTGEGARLYGGRFNRVGTAVVYTSGSLALALLEGFVHLGRAARRMKFVYHLVQIPDKVVETLTAGQLPKNWREEPPPLNVQQIGTDWVESCRSAVLRVPSAIVPEEWNYVLNPAHPDYREFVRSNPASFTFDPRMWK